jgi:hypothetical protein
MNAERLKQALDAIQGRWRGGRANDDFENAILVPEW